MEVGVDRSLGFPSARRPLPAGVGRSTRSNVALAPPGVPGDAASLCRRWWVLAAAVMMFVLTIFVMGAVENKTLDYLDHQRLWQRI